MGDNYFDDIILKTIGEASVCWGEVPHGVFDSSKAILLGQRLSNAFNGYMMAREKAEAALRDQLEVERMRLAACGVAAMCNTPRTAEQQRIARDNPYYSASYYDVCRAVDSQMALRAQVRKAEAALSQCDGVPHCACEEMINDVLKILGTDL